MQYIWNSKNPDVQVAREAVLSVLCTKLKLTGLQTLEEVLQSRITWTLVLAVVCILNLQRH